MNGPPLTDLVDGDSESLFRRKSFVRLVVTQAVHRNDKSEFLPLAVGTDIACDERDMVNLVTSFPKVDRLLAVAGRFH